MSNDNNIAILKMLLHEADEKPKTFEEDPMEFILNKYVSLDDILTELMTSSYREYLNAVYIISPKPTSFKVVLHNEQYFYLTYMGPAYEASVAGKNYYLLNVGEKERCMLAISKLLRGGNPLKTKGPEGAEQGAEAEEGGESEGGELSAAGGAETGGGEGAGGGEESLTESKKYVDTILLKLLIEEEVKKNKALSLNNVLQNGLKATGQKSDLVYKGKGAHFRVNLGDTTEAVKKIEKILKGYDNSDYYKIDIIEKDDFASGAKSGTYQTIKVTVTKPTKDLNPKDEAFVVNTRTERSTITIKSLTPGNLGLSGRTFKNSNVLVTAISSSISTKVQDKKLAQLLIELTNEVNSKAIVKYDDVRSIQDIDESITMSDNVKAMSSQYTPTDINTIGKDFGEILGPVFLLKAVDKKAKGIHFPKSISNPLVDFELDDYTISSKYEKGAASALTAIIKQTDVKKLDEKQLKLYNILKTIPENKTSESYLVIAKMLNAPAINTLAKIVGTKVEDLSVSSIQNKIVNSIKKQKATTSEEKSKVVMSLFNSFYQTIGRYPENKKINFDKIVEGKEYGAIIGPLSYYVADYLNEGTEESNYREALTQLISKIEIKQLYLTFDLSKNQINFKVKSFTSSNSNFVFKIGNQSVYTPDQNKLAFQLV